MLMWEEAAIKDDVIEYDIAFNIIYIMRTNGKDGRIWRSRNNETSGVELVVVGVFAFCLAVVAWLMKTFDVEWQTALETAPGLTVWLLVVGAGIFFGIKMETGLVRWGAPLAIALLIPVFKPILKEAAGVREMGGLVFDDMVSWYGTGWGMSLMFFGILIVGYGLLYWWHRRNSYYW